MIALCQLWSAGVYAVSFLLVSRGGLAAGEGWYCGKQRSSPAISPNEVAMTTEKVQNRSTSWARELPFEGREITEYTHIGSSRWLSLLPASRRKRRRPATHGCRMYVASMNGRRRLS